MKTLIVAAAVLGFSAVSASAECSYSQHMAKAKTDPTITASVAQPAMSTPVTAEVSEQTVLPKEED